MAKLSDAQKAVLTKMEAGKWYCAYDLKASLATMTALERKGYVRRSPFAIGDYAFPRTSIEWCVCKVLAKEKDKMI